MAYDIQWLDRFDVYDTEAALLNGTPWVVLDVSRIIDDPDPLTPAGSKCLFPLLSASGHGPKLSTVVPGTFMRFACRIWLTALPNSTVFSPCIAFEDSGGNLIYHFEIAPAGNMLAYSGGNPGTGDHGTLLADTGVPVVFANSWNHFEFAVNSASGDISVWKEGAPIASLTGTLDGSPGGSTISLINPGEIFGSGLGTSTLRIKDGHVATGSTQLGPRSVLRQNVDGTVSSGWTAVNGTAEADIYGGYSNILTFSANTSSGKQVVVDTTYYQFTSGNVDSGAPDGTSGHPWLVDLGVDAATSIANLYNAIGATGTPGTTYSTALTAHSTVGATGYSSTQLGVKGKTGTDLSTPCTVSSSSNMSWKTSTLNQGANDFDYMDADSTLPAASITTLADLPPWVVSIAATMPLIRQQKTDGGTAKVQDSMVSGSSSTAGTDRGITTAFTYYWDVIENDPATGALWTLAAFNAANGKTDRTA